MPYHTSRLFLDPCSGLSAIATYHSLIPCSITIRASHKLTISVTEHHSASALQTEYSVQCTMYADGKGCCRSWQGLPCGTQMSFVLFRRSSERADSNEVVRASNAKITRHWAKGRPHESVTIRCTNGDMHILSFAMAYNRDLL